MPRARRPLLLALLLVAGPAAATGFGGADAPARIPVPAKVFEATVEDVSGNTQTVHHVTFDGEVFVFGDLGEGRATVPFEKIAELRIEPTQTPEDRIAFAKLHDGTSVRLVVDADTPCYGETAFGNYRIELEKVRKVTFRALTSD